MVYEILVTFTVLGDSIHKKESVFGSSIQITYSVKCILKAFMYLVVEKCLFYNGFSIYDRWVLEI